MTILVFLMPFVAAVMMGAVSLLIYRLLSLILAKIMGAYICNTISTIVAIVSAAGTYVVCLLKFGGYTEEMLLAFPKGAFIAKIAKKIHLIK